MLFICLFKIHNREAVRIITQIHFIFHYKELGHRCVHKDLLHSILGHCAHKLEINTEFFSRSVTA